MSFNLDINKARIYLKYLSKAAKKKPKETQASPLLSEKLNRLSRRLDRLIQLEKIQKPKEVAKAELRYFLQKKFSKIKQLLKQAKAEKADPEKLFALIERAENIKKKIDGLD